MSVTSKFFEVEMLHLQAILMPFIVQCRCKITSLQKGDFINHNGTNLSTTTGVYSIKMDNIKK